VASSTYPQAGLVGTAPDRALIERRHTRCGLGKFTLWLTPWFGLLALGIYAMYLCLRYGLHHTNMDNRFAFGLWIFLDLSVIALGAGAFFTGFLVYILKMKELKAVIYSAVVIGFLCYSGAVLVLAIDVGQPGRAWFTFWHPNVHSMLTEVTFCITAYLTVLAFEYVPIVLKNRKLKQVPSFLVFEFEMHKLVPVLAAVGTFLSFFHQGSLGGLYGVLRGRPFAYREGFFIWPSTFFLFVLSAIAVGPAFVMLTTWMVEKITGKRLVRDEVKQKLGRISGMLLVVYVAFKSIDTLIWLNSTSRGSGFLPWEYYAWEPFGFWVLLAEIVLCGFVPAVLLLWNRTRMQQSWLVLAAVLACAGVVVNRFVLTIQTLALPTLPFDEFLTYSPSWEEVATFLAVIAYAVIVYSLSYRYLRVFPQEKELSEGGARVSDR
jgi:molybdopterin-containing oxidoreductase family membrane subunit